MSKNLISATAQDIYDQIQKCKVAKGQDLQREVLRMESMALGADAISELADKQIKVLYATGFLPDENFLVDKDETKLVNARNDSSGIRNTKRPAMLIDEFIGK